MDVRLNQWYRQLYHDRAIFCLNWSYNSRKVAPMGKPNYFQQTIAIIALE